MPLKVYNSLTKSKEIFEPREAQQVSMYVCGVTVYDYCHLGHARSGVVFDMLYRYLQFSGYAVTYVKNFTDIDDKIIQRASENNEDWKALVARYIDAFHEDMDALGLKRPTHEPKATDYIQSMQNLITQLMDQDLAYTVGGDVFYRVDRFKDYGKLAHRKLDDLEVGARVEANSNKENPLDFVLWKAQKPGEPAWDSPWGSGRPGWHIECSCMSTDLLGPSFDIHGGGRDLLFPHHENEIAQSEGAFGQQFARYWLHNGFVNLNSDKMSKSTGNFLTIREALKEYPKDVLRYFLLSVHYSSPLDFNDQNLKQAFQAVERVYQCKKLAENFADSRIVELSREPILEKLEQLKDKFTQAMDDDFNAAAALGFLFDVVRDVNRILDHSADADLKVVVAQNFLKVLQPYQEVCGLFELSAEEYFSQLIGMQSSKQQISPAEIEALIEQRLQARQDKNWAEADRIRDLLKEQNVELKDSAQGTEWSYTN